MKRGIKSFMLCDGEVGYVYNSEICKGREESLYAELGAVGNVVVVRLLLLLMLMVRGSPAFMDRY